MNNCREPPNKLSMVQYVTITVALRLFVLSYAYGGLVHFNHGQSLRTPASRTDPRKSESLQVKQD